MDSLQSQSIPHCCVPCLGSGFHHFVHHHCPIFPPQNLSPSNFGCFLSLRHYHPHPYQCLLAFSCMGCKGGSFFAKTCFGVKLNLRFFAQLLAVH